MKIGIYSESFKSNNDIFEKDKYTIGENLEYSFVLLRDTLANKGIELCTIDTYPLSEFKQIIFLDLPLDNNLLFQLSKMEIELYLFIFESAIVYPRNWEKKLHKYFIKIFTWNDDWVDNERYFKFFLPNKISPQIDFNNKDKTKFCTLIAGNKFVKDSKELYSKRLEAIKWFEKNHWKEFDLYGIGWDEYKFKGKITRALNRVKFLRKLFSSKFKTYKGRLNKKSEVLKKYKFSICFENAKSIPGYITEKIFDSLFTGCIPVYLGAPNISNFIPENTFINFEKFNNFDDLYKYMFNMKEEDYSNYIKNIKEYLQSEQIKLFSAENYVSIVMNQIIFSKDDKFERE